MAELWDGVRLPPLWGPVKSFYRGEISPFISMVYEDYFAQPPASERAWIHGFGGIEPKAVQSRLRLYGLAILVRNQLSRQTQFGGAFL